VDTLYAKKLVFMRVGGILQGRLYTELGMAPIRVVGDNILSRNNCSTDKQATVEACLM
jgi:hypothetical protein